MKVLLFDFDGVIVDSFGFCYEIVSSREPLTAEEYRARFEGNINDAPKPVLPPTQPPFDFIGQYTTKLMACTPHQDVIKVIQELAQTHDCIIISSTISHAIQTFLNAHGLSSLFKEILGNDVEKSKVKKIAMVLERYQITPSETIFITDTLGDIREAKKCDVDCIAVTWGFHSREALKRGEPLAIVDRAADILTLIKSREIS